MMNRREFLKNTLAIPVVTVVGVGVPVTVLTNTATSGWQVQKLTNFGALPPAAIKRWKADFWREARAKSFMETYVK
jgi:hypothetical protein